MKKALKKAKYLAILIGSHNIQIVFNSDASFENGNMGVILDWHLDYNDTKFAYFNTVKELNQKLDSLIKEHENR